MVICTQDKVLDKESRWKSRSPHSGARGSAPSKLLNIGSEHPVQLLSDVKLPGPRLGKKASTELLPPAGRPSTQFRGGSGYLDWRRRLPASRGTEESRWQTR